MESSITMFDGKHFYKACSQMNFLHIQATGTINIYTVKGETYPLPTSTSCNGRICNIMTGQMNQVFYLRKGCKEVVCFIEKFAKGTDRYYFTILNLCFSKINTILTTSQK